MGNGLRMAHPSNVAVSYEFVADWKLTEVVIVIYKELDVISITLNLS